MFVILSVFWLLIISYVIFVLVMWILWNRIPSYQTAKNSQFKTRVSIIVPVRNEEKNIEALLDDLNKQDYPPHLFEVIVVDDASDDHTVQKVMAFNEHAKISISLIKMGDKASGSPKKAAIEAAIQQSNGEFLITTDGDCRLSAGWITTYITMYEQTGARLISGPVTFIQEDTFTDHLQTTEFSSLIGTGAACIQAGYPTMCNGANLGYTKSTFLEVGGYDGVREIASGDDEFLLHKIKKHFPDSIKFLKNQEAVVSTQPHKTWTGFFNQRKRWASKWQYYTSATPKIMAAYIFLCNAVLPISLVLGFTGHIYMGAVLFLWLLKCLPEWLLISTVLRFLGKSRSIVYIPIVQLMYPFYILIFGLSGSSKNYVWKGRTLK